MSTALITGASQGFGRALALDLAAQGWTVVAGGRSRGRLTEVQQLEPERIVTVRGDVRDHDHQAALVEGAQHTGRLDLLVLNASTLGPSPLPHLAELEPADLARIFEINVVAPLELTQLALPLLNAAPAPIVVALSSDAAVAAYEGWGGYGSSKAALDQLMNVLGAEQEGLAVYGFDPGDMRTDMHQRAFAGEDISDRPLPESVVPALRELMRRRPSSGRYRASEFTLGALA